MVCERPDPDEGLEAHGKIGQNGGEQNSGARGGKPVEVELRGLSGGAGTTGGMR